MYSCSILLSKTSLSGFNLDGSLFSWFYNILETEVEAPFRVLKGSASNNYKPRNQTFEKNTSRETLSVLTPMS